MLTTKNYTLNPENWLGTGIMQPYATPVQVSNQINDYITNQTKDQKNKRT